MTKKWSKVSRSIFEQKQYYKQCPCQSEESLEEEESSTEEEEEVEDSEESSSLFEGSSRNEKPGPCESGYWDGIDCRVLDSTPLKKLFKGPPPS